MKSPEEYVDAQCAGPERPATVTHAQATAAVRQALADAKRYKENLVHALRHCNGAAAVQQMLSGFNEPVPDSGTVLVGADILPWRALPAPARRPLSEEPPF